MTSRNPQNSYDEIPYDSQPDRYCTPAILSSIGRLFGHLSPEVTTARVLELGCANGGNILPLAMAFPKAIFIGVDLSKSQIEDGVKMVEAVGLKNITLKSEDILKIGKDFGQFDYILCHGVFSWVSFETQQKLFEICRENLSPQGIAYLSYNTYPGWHFRGMVREMMLYHTDQFTDATTRVSQARALLNLLIESTTVDETSTYGSAYGRLLHDEAEILKSSTDSYLYHEHLEDHNEPIYFHNFMQRAEKFKLRFLGEATFSEMIPKNFSADIGETLANISQGIIQMEQYMDFIKNRMFRRTLLCHQEVELNRELTPAKLSGMYISSSLKPNDSELDPLARFEMSFHHKNGTTVQISKPIQKVALCHLAEIYPKSITIEELASCCRSQLGSRHSPIKESDVDAIGDLIIECYSSALIELSTIPVPFETIVPKCPKANPLSRYQASIGRNITTLAHQVVRPGEIDRHLVYLFDGTRTLDQVVSELVKLAQQGKIVVQEKDQPTSDLKVIKKILTEAAEESISRLMRNAIFSLSESFSCSDAPAS